MNTKITAIITRGSYFHIKERNKKMSQTIIQKYIEEGRKEQFEKDMKNDMKTLKELGIEKEKIKELMMKYHGLTEEEVEKFLIH